MITLDMTNLEPEYEIECGMYIASCLSETQEKMLKSKWNENGGQSVMPWYKWVLENVHIELDGSN